MLSRLSPTLLLPLTAAGLFLSCLTLPPAAHADDATLPPGLLGAWGDDSSCTADVAVFRPDGTVVLGGAGPDSPVTRYALNGGSITFTQGSQSGTFAFGLNGQAVAWSNGTTMVLKTRCADQSPFAAEMKTAAASAPAAPPSPTPPVASPEAASAAPSLFDRVKAMAAGPALFNGMPIQILSVTSQPAGAPTKDKPAYGEIIAHPDPQMVGPDATLIYRVFADEAAAADYVSLAPDKRRGSFAYIGHGPGFFATDAAKDEGPKGAQAQPVTIACLRFHPLGKKSVTISCFAHMPGTPLVVGGEQTYPLPKTAKARDMGPAQDLSEALDLTGIAIAQARTLLTEPPKP
ncbi:hypothetical protein [Acidisoma sp. 7E03]